MYIENIEHDKTLNGYKALREELLAYLTLENEPMTFNGVLVEPSEDIQTERAYLRMEIQNLDDIIEDLEKQELHNSHKKLASAYADADEISNIHSINRKNKIKDKKPTKHLHASKLRFKQEVTSDKSIRKVKRKYNSDAKLYRLNKKQANKKVRAEKFTDFKGSDYKKVFDVGFKK